MHQELKITAKAPANIALIKYWGNADNSQKIPNNNSISMNMSNTHTTTTVWFSSTLSEDDIRINDQKITGKDLDRTVRFLDVVRAKAQDSRRAHVESTNTIPMAAGIASSASGFAALAAASTAALNLKLSEKDLSRIARRGSGSATRSIPGGFVEWIAGNSDETSYAQTMYPASYWDLVDVIAIVNEKRKGTTSHEGHTTAQTSPFYLARLQSVQSSLRDIHNAFKNKDFSLLGSTMEADMISLHSIMMSSVPPLFYWAPQTLAVMEAVREGRKEGIESYYTIDAGPNVHVFCEKKNIKKISDMLRSVVGVQSLIVTEPTGGTEIIKKEMV